MRRVQHIPRSVPLARDPGLLPTGQLLARGVRRLLADQDYAVLTEVPVAGGDRRADVAGLHRSGEIVIVEVKSRFYFAVPGSFPQDLLPKDVGLIVADPFGGDVVRDAEAAPLHAARRSALTLRFARKAAASLSAHLDPGPVGAPQA